MQCVNQCNRCRNFACAGAPGSRTRALPAARRSFCTPWARTPAATRGMSAHAGAGAYDVSATGPVRPPMVPARKRCHQAMALVLNQGARLPPPAAAAKKAFFAAAAGGRRRPVLPVLPRAPSRLRARPCRQYLRAQDRARTRIFSRSWWAPPTSACSGINSIVQEPLPCSFFLLVHSQWKTVCRPLRLGRRRLGRRGCEADERQREHARPQSCRRCCPRAQA